MTLKQEYNEYSSFVKHASEVFTRNRVCLVHCNASHCVTAWLPHINIAWREFRHPRRETRNRLMSSLVWMMNSMSSRHHSVIFYLNRWGNPASIHSSYSPICISFIFPGRCAAHDVGLLPVFIYSRYAILICRRHVFHYIGIIAKVHKFHSKIRFPT